MESLLILCLIIVIAAAVVLLWNYLRLRRDLNNFTENLDRTLGRMLQEERLEAVPYQADDLWGAIYDRLFRLSGLYLHKQEELSEEKAMLKELVSDISHQTKTPLSNIRLYLDLLLMEQTDFGQKEHLEKLNGQVEKLEFLIQSMVKMSRLETGSIRIHKQPLPVSDTLALAIGAVVPKAEQKHISLHVDYDETLCLLHDKKWTAEALFNILDNAVKYTPSGGSIHIRVDAQEIFTHFSIRDTGKGIATERQGAVFTRFYREPEVHDADGAGLGLYLARKIITLQQGYIELYSQPGEGSTFLVCLPNEA